MAALYKMNYGYYTNRNAVENVVRYITRTRENETRADELICWGSFNTLIYDIYGNKNPEIAIRQFCDVQEFYDIKRRKGTRIFHETFNLLPEEYEEIMRFNNLYHMLFCCCEYYNAQGFQVVYALHHSKEKGVHIHFVVNAISYVTGLKWQSWFASDKERAKAFNSYIHLGTVTENN